MGEISILDLQNLRHLIGGYATTYSKMTDYGRPGSQKIISGCGRFRNEK
jgi:hypothetical protein